MRIALFARLVAIAFALISSSALAQPKTCAARSDCPAPLRCLQNVCVSESAFLAVQPEESRRDRTVSTPKDEPTRAFLGWALGGVLPAVFGNAGAGGQFAMRVGVLVDGHGELALEIGGAAIGGMSPSVAGVVDVVGTFGYLIPISDMVSWIVRIGGGGGSVFGNDVNFTGGVFPFGEVRLDVFGVAIKTSKNVLVEFNAPSFRVMFMPENTSNTAMFMWVTNVTLNYLF